MLYTFDKKTFEHNVEACLTRPGRLRARCGYCLLERLLPHPFKRRMERTQKKTSSLGIALAERQRMKFFDSCIL